MTTPASPPGKLPSGVSFTLPLSSASPQPPGISSPTSPQSPIPHATVVQEGQIHYYEGYIARRSSVLKRWKKRKPYAVVPGMSASQQKKKSRDKYVCQARPTSPWNYI